MKSNSSFTPLNSATFPSPLPFSLVTTFRLWVGPYGPEREAVLLKEINRFIPAAVWRSRLGLPRPPVDLYTLRTSVLLLIEFVTSLPLEPNPLTARGSDGPSERLWQPVGHESRKIDFFSSCLRTAKLSSGTPLTACSRLANQNRVS